MKISALVPGPDAPSIIRSIRAAEDAGLHGVWMTSGGTAPDPLTIFAAAAGQTNRIQFGSAIIQTFPRHPLALVQQAIVVDQLAPGRLILGVGPSGPMAIRPTFGIPFERPQEHLRDYVTILRSILSTGSVDYDGPRISAHAKLAGPTRVRVMAAALRSSAFRLCGELADGAISWLCPPPYLAAEALPALAEGARLAGHPTPALVAHIVVALTTDAPAARESVRKAFGFFARVQTYQDMFGDAGFPEAKATGQWSDAMCDAVCIHGDEATVRAGLTALAATGADEAMVSILAPDPATHARTLTLLGEANR